MSLVKITNGTVDTYPYSVGQLRRDNPQTSFPKRIPDEMLADWDVYPVTYEDVPDIDDRTQGLEQNSVPAQVNGAWTVGWTITDKTEEEVQEHDKNTAANVRSQRNSLLSESDWTQVADAPVDAQAWATYRQALRDVTDQPNFPYDINWPVKPE